MKKKKNKGGELLGTGSYGCVYKDKPLNSKINDNNKLVKILFNNEDFIKEVMTTLLINKIDTYTSPKIENISFIEKNDITNPDELDKIKKCKLYDKEINNTDAIYQIIYGAESIGIDLKKIIKNKKQIKLDNILANAIKLYEALELYDKYNIVHRDIKPDNIIYLENNNKLIFIDFGLMSTYSDVFNSYGLLKFDYVYYPPEFKLIYSLHKNESFDQFINRFFNNFSFNTRYKNFIENLLNYYPSYENDLLSMYNLYNSFKNKYKEYDIHDFFSNKDKSKIDVYSLSLTLYEIIMLYISELPNLIDDNKFVTNFIIKVILPGINFNNKKRFTASEILKNIKTLNHKDENIMNILNQPSLYSLLKIPNKKNFELSTKSTVENIPPPCVTNNTRKKLLAKGKELNIKYRHKFNKKILCEKIEKKII